MTAASPDLDPVPESHILMDTRLRDWAVLVAATLTLSLMSSMTLNTSCHSRARVSRASSRVRPLRRSVRPEQQLSLTLHWLLVISLYTVHMYCLYCTRNRFLPLQLGQDLRQELVHSLGGLRHQRAPDGRHALLDPRGRVILIPIQLRDDLGRKKR